MIRLRALGECAFEIGDERLGPEAEMAFALLLVLVLMGGRRVARRQLVDLLWPATSEERARHNLRQTVYKLRQLGVPVETETGYVRVDPAEVDARLVLPGELDDELSALLQRPDLPFGEFLAGYAPRFAAQYATWVEEQRGVVHARLRRALLTLLTAERRRGRWGAVETLARRCLLVDPLNEEATMALAEATALTGSKRAALQLLDGYLQELGPGAGEMRLPAAVLRRRIAERVPPTSSFTPVVDCFVGREASVAFLREHQRAVTEAGTPRSVLVWGSEGMGKSRLVAEFSRMAELDGMHVVMVGSRTHDVERPLSAYVDLVPLLQALPGAIGCSPESIEHLRRLTDHDPEMVEPSYETREAELLFASVRRAIFDLVDAVAHEAPLVLCIEDVHWLDEHSWRVTRELVARLEGRAVLFLFTSRLPHATAHPPSRPLPWLELHNLPPLDHAAALALFETESGPGAPPPAFRDWAIHVAEGNPFFLRALAAHWLETGQLRAPTSLEVLVRERVSRLGGRTLRLLQACAVLGKQSTIGRLDAVLEYPRHELLDAAAELEEGGFLLVEGSSISCRHELIVEAAVSGLADGTRRLLHRCAGEVLEREIYSARSAALIFDCVQQWLAAGERTKAMALMRSSAAHLIDVGLPHEAAEAYERALDLCETDLEQLEMLEGLATANKFAGRWPRVVTALNSIRKLTKNAWQTDLHSDRELLEFEARWRAGDDFAELLALASDCAREQTAMPGHRLRAGWLGLIFADNLCDSTAAEEIYQTLSPLLMAGASTIPTRDAQQVAMIYHASYGELDRAVTLARQLADDAPDRRDPSDWIRRASRATIPLRRAGHFAEACTLVRTALALAEERSLAGAAVSAADIITMIMLEQDDVHSAAKWYERAYYWAQMQEGRVASEQVHYIAARIALWQGNLASARQLLGSMRFALLTEPRVRARNEELALRLDLHLRESDGAPDRSLVHALDDGFRRAKRHGGQDYPCAVLVRSLLRLGAREHAQETLHNYITAERRESAPLPAFLQAIVST